MKLARRLLCLSALFVVACGGDADGTESASPTPSAQGQGGAAAQGGAAGAKATGGAAGGMALAGMSQAGMGQAGMGQAGMGQAAAGQGGTGQAGSGQAGMGQAGVGQAGMGQAGMGQGGVGQAGMGQAGMGQAGMGQAGMGQAGTGQAGMGQGGSAQGGEAGAAQGGSGQAGAGGYAVKQRVLVLSFDPPLASKGGLRVSQAFGWNDPHALADGYIADMYEASAGTITYEIASWVDRDDFPTKGDGFAYDGDSYAACIEKTGPCHDPDGVDYVKLLEEVGACSAVTAGDYDEIWLFGGPYFGYWESTMAGDGAFWLNSPAVPLSCGRRFVVMGFNYERGVGEMTHDFGHRTESTMDEVFKAATPPHPFALYRQYARTSPNDARCGDTHNPPNAASEYDYGNHDTVGTYCNAYLGYPDLELVATPVTCEAWGCEQRGYMKWWLAHLPRAEGQLDGYHNNWWRYLLEFDTYLKAPPAPAACESYATIAECDAHKPDCAYYLCASACHKTGTPENDVCGPTCTQYTTVADCDAHSADCAWYFCANGCHAKGTPDQQVCP